jgi:hypothetical protein
MFTASQNITRNHGGGKSAFFVIIENIVLSVLKRFRFLEVGIVTEVDARIARVRCNLPYQGRESKWLKVYMPFASNGEGIFAMPNVGDHGLVFFILGDLNAGIFINASWGGAIEVPDTGVIPTGKDVIIKRNGSWFKINGTSKVDVVHKKGNAVTLTDGYVLGKTPDGQRFSAQKYHVYPRTDGSKEPLLALKWSKLESAGTKVLSMFKRQVVEPKGDISADFCPIDAIAEAIANPQKSSEVEMVNQDRLIKHIDVNNNDSDINTLSWQRTREVFSVPKNSNLAEPFVEGSTVTQVPTLIEKHGEVFMSTWIAQDCCAFLSIRTSVLGDQRSAAFEVQVMSDGRVETYRVQPNEDSLSDDGFMQSFFERIASELHPTDETDGVDVGSISDIEEGLIDVPQI